ncbi:ubiquitin-like modifier 1 [Amylocystis lapponica]|nr:ubiquitin-like modifier 1 [Amylocystis lapponica]
MASPLSLKIEFSGGLELLFSNQRSHRISLPAHVPSPSVKGADAGLGRSEQEQARRPADIAYLIFWLRDNLLKEREALFVEDGTVRPGILVLVNDTDWELEGEGEYVLKDGDEVVFISTLHGG